MRMRGIEPPRGHPHTDLNRARLPVPPHPRGPLILIALTDPATLRVCFVTGGGYHRRIVRRRLLLLLPLALLALAPDAHARPLEETASATVEVIVELAPPPAARTGYRRPGRERAARAALISIDTAQRAAERRILQAVPAARVRWRYRIVLDGLAVVVPAADVGHLGSLPGVVGVYPSVRYHGLLDRSPGIIGAPAVWGPGLENAGEGIKIGVIDDGIDPSHPFFDPDGFAAPPGFPKGQSAFTTAKVIVARAFPPPASGWRNAERPFDPIFSFHGTHVAGIAAGDHGTVAPAEGGRPRRELSGVAPRAYLGNYKALTVPTDAGFGLNGNSPELVAAIEAAVADGMDVINLSLGEPQIDPERDAVAKALDNAAAAGVIPVVAAGNDFEELGRGSIGSPGTSRQAITVAAVTKARVVATFSSSGPTPLDLAFKPDVSAPGVDILSAQPGGHYELLSGTSMASPNVAGAAALLRQLHPDWTVEEVKSALVLTATPVRPTRSSPAEVRSTREGGGLVDLPAAASPLVFTSPQGLGFGLLDVSGGETTAELTVSLTDAGGGEGTWSVGVEEQGTAEGAAVEASETVEVPGSLTVTASAGAGAAEGERTGFIVLEHEGLQRRLPFWYRVTRPQLAGEPSRLLGRPGVYRGNTRGREARVDTYRYPDARPPVTRRLSGPEQVFQIVLARPVANLGVAVVHMPREVDVEPRIVSGADENRLAGIAALPFASNPYLTTFFGLTRSAAALLPSPGTYSVVFDTPKAGRAGPFTFRLWIDDVTPPRVELVSRAARSGRILVRARDAGSGVDPGAIFYTLDDGFTRQGWLDRRGLAVLDVSDARPGLHRLRLQVSDRQEAKNNENVASILPNTRVLETTIRIPRGG